MKRHPWGDALFAGRTIILSLPHRHMNRERAFQVLRAIARELGDMRVEYRLTEGATESWRTRSFAVQGYVPMSSDNAGRSNT